MQSNGNLQFMNENAELWYRYGNNQNRKIYGNETSSKRTILLGTLVHNRHY